MKPIDAISELYLGDYFADTLHFSSDEHQAFRLLLLHIWIHGRLPRFKRKLASLAQKTPAEWQEMRDIISPLLKTSLENIASWKQSLRRYDGQRLPPAEWHILRAIILERDGQACTYCGDTRKLHVDHKLPIASGGSNDFENLVTCCARCNLSKGKKLLEEWQSC